MMTEGVEFTEDGRPLRRFFDWFRTVPFLFFFIGTLVLHDCIQRIVTPCFGRKGHERVNRWLNRSIVRVIQCFAADVQLRSHPDVPEKGPVLIVSNHQSLMDIPYITTLLPHLSPRFISKVELSRGLPYVSYALRTGGHALIDRKKAVEAVREIKKLAAHVQEWESSVAIFPEGTRARRGGIGKLKGRGLKTLLEVMPDAPIVVVAISNAWKLSSYKLLPVPSDIHIGIEVLSVKKRSPNEDVEALIEDIFHELRDHVKDFAPQEGKKLSQESTA